MTDHHDANNVTRIHADPDGLPCFGCYFGAVYDALRPDQLHEVEIGPDEDPGQVEIARRIGGTLAYMADGIVAVVMHALGPDAPELVEVFTERVQNMVVLMRAPCDDQAH